jgi:hypothetical protein
LLGGYPFWTFLEDVPLAYPKHAYEMFAFCASSIVAAVGGVNSMAGLGGAFDDGRNLRVLPGTTAFDGRNTGHSAQFVHSYLDVGAYWRRLMEDIK